MPPLLEVADLRVHFKPRRSWLRQSAKLLKAVDGVSFSVEAGRTLALVGESGCGKTTLARAILCLQPATSGSVFLDGDDLTTLDKRTLTARRRDLQIIFQDPYASLSPRRTVAETIREPLDAHKIGTPGWRERRVSELLTVVGLREHDGAQYPHEFSAGQRQRIGIARALALSPRLIVADEPVSSLDVSVQSQVLELITRLQREQNIAFVFISHDLAVVQHVSHEIAVMYLGQIVEHTDTRSFFAGPRHPYSRALLAAVPRPDPHAPRSRAVLRGEVPSPLDPPPGCPFHTRCPEVMDRCSRAEPAEIDVGGPGHGHLVRCHLYGERRHSKA